MNTSNGAALLLHDR